MENSNDIFSDLKQLFIDTDAMVDIDLVLSFLKYEFTLEDLKNKESLLGAFLSRSIEYKTIKDSLIFFKFEDFEYSDCIPSNKNLIPFVYYIFDIYKTLDVKEFYFIVNQNKEALYVKELEDGKYLITGIFSLFMNEEAKENIVSYMKEKTIIFDYDTLTEILNPRLLLIEYLELLNNPTK